MICGPGRGGGGPPTASELQRRLRAERFGEPFLCWRDAGGERLLDVQWRTEHLARLGAVDVPRAAYLRRLAAVLSTAPAFAADAR